MKKNHLFLVLTAVVAFVFVMMGCSSDPSNPMNSTATPEKTQTLTPPDGVVTSLQVSKTAEGHWNRYLDWTVTKAADPTSAEVCVDEDVAINYTVNVTQEGYTDKYLVSGTITIVNDQGEEGEDKTAYIKYVDDAVEARVDRQWVTVQRVTSQEELTIETGGTLVIPYEVEFTPPEGYKSLRNVVYVYLKNHAPGPDTPKEFLYRVSFDLPETPTIINECVDVNDTMAGFLGEVCGEGASETFTYSKTVSYSAPGEYTVENTATANGASATATVTVLVNDCGGGDCKTETAWGGDSAGGGSAWWYYFDTQGDATQAIYAGQKETDGTITYDAVNDVIYINLGSWSLQDDGEAVKVQGYDVIPGSRPSAGLFTTYKGTNLAVPGDGSRYYAIHLDVQLCED